MREVRVERPPVGVAVVGIRTIKPNGGERFFYERTIGFFPVSPDAAAAFAALLATRVGAHGAVSCFRQILSTRQVRAVVPALFRQPAASPMPAVGIAVEVPIETPSTLHVAVGVPVPS